MTPTLKQVHDSHMTLAQRVSNIVARLKQHGLNVENNHGTATPIEARLAVGLTGGAAAQASLESFSNEQLLNEMVNRGFACVSPDEDEDEEEQSTVPEPEEVEPSDRIEGSPRDESNQGYGDASEEIAHLRYDLAKANQKIAELASTRAAQTPAPFRGILGGGLTGENLGAEKSQGSTAYSRMNDESGAQASTDVQNEAQPDPTQDNQQQNQAAS